MFAQRCIARRVLFTVLHVKRLISHYLCILILHTRKEKENISYAEALYDRCSIGTRTKKIIKAVTLDVRSGLEPGGCEAWV
jgi:hypothetical protein